VFEWWDKLFESKPDLRSLEQRRGENISERMNFLGNENPRFVTGDRDSYGGSAEEGADYQKSQIDATKANSNKQALQQAEEARNFAFDKQNADPRHWDGHTTPDGRVMFNDFAAREADTDRGRAMKKKLNADSAAHRKTYVADLLGVAPDEPLNK
jgi:hypothetical protein